MLCNLANCEPIGLLMLLLASLSRKIYNWTPKSTKQLFQKSRYSDFKIRVYIAAAILDLTLQRSQPTLSRGVWSLILLIFMISPRNKLQKLIRRDWSRTQWEGPLLFVSAFRVGLPAGFFFLFIYIFLYLFVIIIVIIIIVIRSPEKFQVTYCDHASPVVVRPLSCGNFRLLLKNHWTNSNQTWSLACCIGT